MVNLKSKFYRVLWGILKRRKKEKYYGARCPKCGLKEGFGYNVFMSNGGRSWDISCSRCGYWTED